MTSSMVSSMSAKYEAPKFDRETDFSLWKTKMRKFLGLQRLWKAVEEKKILGVRMDRSSN